METWQQLSDDALRSAEVLLREGHYRSSVSRSYYAAYCAATNEIVKVLTTFPNQWNNPPHAKVPVYVQNNLSLSDDKKKTILSLIITLREFREDADYRPSEEVDERIARDCIRDAGAVQEGFWGATP